MMLILPFKVDLSLGRWPWVTLAIVGLCVAAHWAQESSRAEVAAAAEAYCEQVRDFPSEPGEDSLATDSLWACKNTLTLIHEYYTPDWTFEWLKSQETDGSVEEWGAYLQTVRRHYDAFASTAPTSLDARLVSSPEYFNPLRSLTSLFSHADWWHLAGNMMFFLAFGPALELLVGSAWRYLAIILLIGLGSDLGYFALGTLNGDRVPSLGYSGVVMGMIGLGAFMMPWARIRVFVWFFYFARTVGIPAWLLAAWYVAWDFYDLVSAGQDVAVAYSAHLSGALIGYAIGWRWLRERRNEIAVELADEIEEARARRDDFGVLSSSRARQWRVVQQHEIYQHQRDRENWLAEIYALAGAGRHAPAIASFVSGVELYAADTEALNYVYSAVRPWPVSRTRTCLTRFYLDHLVAEHRWRDTLDTVEYELTLDPDFAMADPATLLPLSNIAVDMQRDRLAFALTHNAHDRYGAAAVDWAEAELLAARLLAERLDNPDAARSILSKLINTDEGIENPRVHALAKALDVPRYKKGS